MRSPLFLFGVLWLAASAQAASVQLEWDAPVTNANGSPLTDLSGYRLYQRVPPAAYGSPLPFISAPTTSAVVSGLTVGQTYAFVVTAVDTSGNESVPSNELTYLVPAPVLPSPVASVQVTWTLVSCTPLTVTFDSPTLPGSSGAMLNGVYQGINFGTNQWAWEGAVGPSTSRHIYFGSDSGNSRTFTFSPAPQRFQGMAVFSGVSGTLTLTDNQGQSHSQVIAPGAMRQVTVTWPLASTTITVAFTAGWEMGLDNITFQCP